MKKIFTIVQWVVAAFFVLMMLGTGSLLSNFFLFIAVFLMAPIKPIRHALEKIKIKSFLCVILAIVLFFVGIIVSPNAESTNTPPTASSTSAKETTEESAEVNNTQVHTTEETVSTEESTTEISSVSTETTTKTKTTTKNSETIKQETTTKKTETAKQETTTKKTETTKQETTTKKTETTKQETTTKKTETAKQETTTKKTETTLKPATPNCKYILNTNSKKFHYPDCGSAATISSKNYAESNDSRDTLISQKYKPCGNCNP